MKNKLKSIEIYRNEYNLSQYPSIVKIDINKELHLNYKSKDIANILNDFYSIENFLISGTQDYDTMYMSVRTDMYNKIIVTYIINGKEEKVDLTEFINMLSMISGINIHKTERFDFKIDWFKNVHVLNIIVKHRIEVPSSEQFELIEIYLGVDKEKKQ